MRIHSLALKTCFVVAALTTYAASCSARRVISQEKSLLAHAHKAADFKLIVIDPAHPNYVHSYVWLSTFRLLHYYDLDEPQRGLRMVTQQIDLHTNRRTRLTTPVENLDMGEVEEGPGLRWLIRTTVGGGGTFTMALKADGTAEWQTHFGVPPAYFWNMDGRRLYESFPKARDRTLIIERDLERPSYAKRLWTALPGFGSYSHCVTTNGHLLGYKRVSASVHGRRNPQAIIVEASVGHTVRLLHRFRVSLPADQEATVQFSPDGTKLLWTLRPTGAVEAQRPYVCTYYVTGLNGVHRHNLGVIPEDRTSIAGVTQVQWLPDSKRISFLYKDEMYTAAIQ